MFMIHNNDVYTDKLQVYTYTCPPHPSATYQNTMELIEIQVIRNDGNPPVNVGGALRLKVHLEL